MKFGLGTVQFGMDYGISNQNGKTPLNEVRAILQYANEKGVNIIDTATSYGDSESILGIALPACHKFRIITKTPVFKKDKISVKDAENLKITFYNSIRRLRQSRLSGLLIHNADDLLSDGGERLFSTMKELQENGLVDKIGVSVYTGEQIDHLLERYDFDLIQVPINVLDQRLINSGHLVRLKEKGIEIHARSVFLQGLLLMEPGSLPQFFDSVKPTIYKYRNFLHFQGLTPLEGALSFVKGIPEIDCLIIGANNLEQLKINLNSFKKNYNHYPLSNWNIFFVNKPKYLYPSLWKLQ